jgi:uncharacterized protein YqgV (UPF0045/DUF77 family)
MGDWIPNYIRKNIDYKAHEILTAKEFNALLNLLITQGDYNSAWLDYLQTKGIPDAVAELSVEQIKEALTEAVAEELAALAGSVVNKTSAHLNTPVFSFLDLSYQADMAEFRSLLEHYELQGDFCIATNLVGLSAAYPSLLTLQSMEVAGHEMVPVGTDGSSFDRLSTDEVVEVVQRAQQYIKQNLTDANVFVYPGGTTVADVQQGVSQVYKYAVNIASLESNVDSDALRFDNLRIRLPVVHITRTHNIETAAVKAIIDDALANNKYCIISVDTSSTTYDEDAVRAVIEYIKAHAGITYAPISAAMNLCETTINNLLRDVFAQLKEVFDTIAQEVIARGEWEEQMRREYQAFKEDLTVGVLQNCYVDYKDEAGETQQEKYLHW